MNFILSTANVVFRNSAGVLPYNEGLAVISRTLCKSIYAYECYFIVWPGAFEEP